MRHRTFLLFTFMIPVGLTTGCFDAHGPAGDGGVRDGALDADVDAAALPSPCATLCEPPRVVARVPFESPLGFNVVASLLDMVVHRGELVVAMSQSALEESGLIYVLARVSRQTGEARLEVVDMTLPDRDHVTPSIIAGALASRGETLTLVAARADPHDYPSSYPFSYQPTVLVGTWEGAATAPRLVHHPLIDPDGEPPAQCPGCLARGAAVGIGEQTGLVGVGAEGELWLGRVDLATAAMTRETLAMPGVVPATSLDARGDRSGVGLLAVGGTRQIAAAVEGPAYALALDESTLQAPISMPGAPSDPTPHPWLHDGALEMVRFQRDEGLSDGRLYWYAIEGDTTVELRAISTAGDLPPLAMASTSSALFWVEASLASVGESDLRVLAARRTCAGDEEAMARTVLHLPRPIGTPDPRALVATEHEGRTYVGVLEDDGGEGRVALVVFDLGTCRTGG
ncbi:MAG: hypothetical protein AB7S26_33240 [Sandaracinaceae bacterium]